MNPWVKGIPVWLNEWSRPFSMVENYKIAKKHWWNLEILLVQIHWANVKHGIKHPWVKGTSGFNNEDHSILKKEIMGFSSLNQRYDIIITLRKCVYWCGQGGPWLRLIWVLATLIETNFFSMQGICKFKDTQFKLKKKKMRRHVIKESRLFFEIQGQSHSIL